MSTMVNYEEAVNKTIETFESKFNDFAKEKRVIDGPATFQHFAFDIIGEITVSPNLPSRRVSPGHS